MTIIVIIEGARNLHQQQKGLLHHGLGDREGVENLLQQQRRLLQFGFGGGGFGGGGPGGGGFGGGGFGGGGFDRNPPNSPNTRNPSTGTHSHTKCKHHCVKGLPGPSRKLK
jgi:hypothetical protein